MYQKVTSRLFRDEFHFHGRGDNFSPLGFRLLFEFLESEEDGDGLGRALDVVEICGSFSECDRAELLNSWGEQIAGVMTAEELEECQGDVCALDDDTLLAAAVRLFVASGAFIAKTRSSVIIRH